MKRLLFALIALGFVLPAHAKIITQTIEYHVGDVTCEGYLVYDDARTAPQPGVLVVHQWMGLTDYEKARCEQLAVLGYLRAVLRLGAHPGSRSPLLCCTA